MAHENKMDARIKRIYGMITCIEATTTPARMITADSELWITCAYSQPVLAIAGTAAFAGCVQSLQIMHFPSEETDVANAEKMLNAAKVHLFDAKPGVQKKVDEEAARRNAQNMAAARQQFEL